jgi:thioredoxin 1
MTAPTGMTDVTDATFEQEVIQAARPVVVDVWAAWCGPCRMLEPIVEALAGEYLDQVRFVRLNSDENPAVSMRYGVRAMPTLLVFKDGQPVQQIVGFRPRDDIKRRIDAALA